MNKEKPLKLAGLLLSPSDIMTLVSALFALSNMPSSVRAVGTGYLRFAQRETGLFRTAFAASDKFLQATPELPTAGPGGLNPFELLGAALDKLVQAGVMPPERRPGAEFLAWSAVTAWPCWCLTGRWPAASGRTCSRSGSGCWTWWKKGCRPHVGC